MKKIKVFGLLLIAILMSTACSKSLTKEERISKANENMKSLENYNLKLTTTMEIQSEGTSMEMKVNVDSQIDAKGKKTKTVSTTNLLGITSKITYYTIEENGMETLYSSSDDKKWSKESSEVPTPTDVNGILELVKEGTSIKEESFENDIYHYSLIISKDNVKKLLEETGNSMTEANSDEYKIKGDLTVHIYIDKDNNVTKLTMDFTDVLDMTNESEDYKLSKMLFEFEFSQFNLVGDVTIPQNIIDSAK